MDVCKDCAMRLFNSKQYNLHGIGNPAFGRCIVIPNVDYTAYKNRSIGFSEQVKVIVDTIHSSTGDVDSLNYLYIVPLIRCCDKIGCKVTDDIYNRCITYFAKDVVKYQFTDILLLGYAAKKFIHCNIQGNTDIVFISPNKRRYVINYSPFVSYTDNKLFDEFKVNLVKWYNAVSNNYSTYRKYIL